MYKRVPRRRVGKKGFTFEFSGFGLTITILSLLIICFLCFTLGIMGGFYLSGKQIKSQLPTEAEIARMLAKEKAHPPKHFQTPKSLAKPESASIGSIRRVEFTPVASARPKPQPTADAKPPQPAAGKEPSPPPVKGKKYMVQAASFQNLAKAHKILDKIESEGFEGSITEVQLGNRGTWFRICLGPYSTESQAKDVSEQLKLKFKFKPIIAKE